VQTRRRQHASRQTIGDGDVMHSVMHSVMRSFRHSRRELLRAVSRQYL
jgi:hypothetical protein